MGWSDAYDFVSIYPKDCCKLLSHEEVVNAEKNGVFYFSRWDFRIAPEETLTNYNFLSIKELDALSNNEGFKHYYELYPITNCGDILN